MHHTNLAVALFTALAPGATCVSARPSLRGTEHGNKEAKDSRNRSATNGRADDIESQCMAGRNTFYSEHIVAAKPFVLAVAGLREDRRLAK
jgi:hypothetical protein